MPQMMENPFESTQGWQHGSSVAVHASMRRLVAEQLGRLLVGFSPGEYLDDFVTYLNTAIVNTLAVANPTGERPDSATDQQAAERVTNLASLAKKAPLI